GRSPACDIVLDHPTISRRHARIQRVDEVFSLADLGSRNGTFVDERRVEACAVPVSGMIRLGGISFSAYVTEVPPPEEQTVSCLADSDRVQTWTASPDAGEDLSPGQERVLDHLLMGLSEKIVAKQLGLSRHTIHNHVRAIFRIHQVHSRAELLAKFIKNG